MVSTNDKKVREAMQRHVLSFYKGDGGRTALVDQIATLMRERSGNYERYPTAYSAGVRLFEGGTFLVYYDDIEKFLRRIGFTDQKRLDKYRNNYGEGAWGLYIVLCARACEEIYKDYMKKHPTAFGTVRRS